MRADHFLQLSKTYRYVMKYHIFKYGILFLFLVILYTGGKGQTTNSISVFRPSVSIASASTPVCPVLLAQSDSSHQYPHNVPAPTRSQVTKSDIIPNTDL